MPHRTQIGFLFVSLVIQQSVAKFRNYTSKLWYRRDLTRFFGKIQICPVTCEIWRNFSAKMAPSVFGVFYFLPPFIFNLFFRNFISWCHSKLQRLCVIHIFENFVLVLCFDFDKVRIFRTYISSQNLTCVWCFFFLLPYIFNLFFS